MRFSKLFFHTYKNAPADADVPSHRLLERGGYIRRLGRGLYGYTPLMWRVLGKLKELIRQEIDKRGGQEIRLPQLQPAELWRRSGRWDEYRAEKLLYSLEDREGNEMCIAPTHEEAVTEFVNNWLTSYKQLPLILYQIAEKFRDEIRPRFGLMRAKEFLMKDAYSFCRTEESLDEQYGSMREAYIAIMERLGLHYVIVKAEGGKIGKGKSEEFQVVADVGEDTILTCGKFASNVEAAVSLLAPYPYDKAFKEIALIDTPGIGSIEDLVQPTGLAKQQMLKTLVYRLSYSDRVDFIAIGLRGDRQINEAKVAREFAPLELRLASEEEVKKLTGASTGFAGPIGLEIPFYADRSVEPMTNFLCGANQDDKHHINVNWGRDCPMPKLDDFLLAEEGDLCPEMPGSTYALKRGIEVGHIFNLGSKYSVQMDVGYQDENGKKKPFLMGCYGIGVGRLAQACVEQNYDDRGIVWPPAIAPYTVNIIPSNPKNELLYNTAESLYLECQEAGIEVLFDDRDERMGFKLKDSDLIGIPLKVIVGKAFEKEGKVEVEPRQGEKLFLLLDEVLPWLKREGGGDVE
ncbi:proline--tRNA ligase [Simkania negevensis]|uniref:Proline--tRNA ligase n=1 Tax=Simkania negevensis TaxID=83561 RepID=A0ABS3APA0_9BACT|nr:proline--tRNA ligase [Simkania negevensis]